MADKFPPAQWGWYAEDYNRQMKDLSQNVRKILDTTSKNMPSRFANKTRGGVTRELYKPTLFVLKTSVFLYRYPFRRGDRRGQIIIDA
jgi:hypothetical protein